MPKKLIGVDIGGTKISIALGTKSGKILKGRLLPTLKGKTGARRSIEVLIEAVRELAGSPIRRHVLGLGIGLPGPVDPIRGIVPFSPHMRGWWGIPLKRLLERRLEIPVFMDNDANAAALGEKQFGAGKGASNFIYITVSTGIGAGFVLDGKLYHGRSFCAGEVGHMTLIPNGRICKCGKKGCLEAYASGSAIGRAATACVRQGLKTAIKRQGERLGSIQAETVAQCAKSGDRLARELIREAGHYMGVGLGTLMNALNPELIILGGSVIKSGPLYWAPMMQAARKTAWQEASKVCRIVRTTLRDYVGNLGAMGLVLENVRP